MHNPDVHAWTRNIKNTLDTGRVTIGGPGIAVTKDVRDYYIRLIKRDFPEISAVIDKMEGRTDPSGKYTDPDLGVDVWAIFVTLCTTAARKGAWAELRETLREMAGHCTQGDSHRMIYLLWALQNGGT